MKVEDLTQAVSADIPIICVELVEGATPLPLFEHPEQALYIFGPEDGSLPQEIVDKANQGSLFEQVKQLIQPEITH